MKNEQYQRVLGVSFVWDVKNIVPNDISYVIYQELLRLNVEKRFRCVIKYVI